MNFPDLEFSAYVPKFLGRSTMSNGKLFGVLSGAQVTIIALGAMLTPAGLYAAVTYSDVAIVNTTTGITAFVDSTRHLYTYDPIAGYTKDPKNIINASYFYYANQTVTVYTVPAGKALLLKTFSMTYNSGTANYDNSVRFNRVPASGTGAYFITGFEDPNIVGTHYSNIEPGFLLASGESLQLVTTVPVNFNFTGDLIPSTAVQ